MTSIADCPWCRESALSPNETLPFGTRLFTPMQPLPSLSSSARYRSALLARHGDFLRLPPRKCTRIADKMNSAARTFATFPAGQTCTHIRT
jgi:hypothetical protein